MAPSRLICGVVVLFATAFSGCDSDESPERSPTATPATSVSQSPTVGPTASPASAEAKEVRLLPAAPPPPDSSIGRRVLLIDLVLLTATPFTAPTLDQQVGRNRFIAYSRD